MEGAKGEKGSLGITGDKGKKVHTLTGDKSYSIFALTPYIRSMIFCVWYE